MLYGTCNKKWNDFEKCLLYPRLLSLRSTSLIEYSYVYCHIAHSFSVVRIHPTSFQSLLHLSSFFPNILTHPSPQLSEPNIHNRSILLPLELQSILARVCVWTLVSCHSIFTLLYSTQQRSLFCSITYSHFYML